MEHGTWPFFYWLKSFSVLSLIDIVLVVNSVGPRAEYSIVWVFSYYLFWVLFKYKRKYTHFCNIITTIGNQSIVLYLFNYSFLLLLILFHDKKKYYKKIFFDHTTERGHLKSYININSLWKVYMKLFILWWINLFTTERGHLSSNPIDSINPIIFFM